VIITLLGVSNSMIVAVTGLGREARIVSRPDIATVVGGGDPGRLREQIHSAIESGAKRVLSIGICAALAPELRVGDRIVATEVVTEDDRFETHQSWARQLLATVPGAQLGAIAGTHTILSSSAEKIRIRRATKAAAADMESHIAAEIARDFALPFAALRVVSDSSTQDLPHAATVGMAPSGEVDFFAVMRSIAAKPSQIPALIRTGWEAEKAFRVLFRCRHVLAPSLAAPNLGELSLDVT